MPSWSREYEKRLRCWLLAQARRHPPACGWYSFVQVMPRILPKRESSTKGESDYGYDRLKHKKQELPELSDRS